MLWCAVLSCVVLSSVKWQSCLCWPPAAAVERHDIHVVPTFVPFNPPPFRVDATNWGETQKIIEAIHRMPLDGVTSRRDADEVQLQSLGNFSEMPLLPGVNF